MEKFAVSFWVIGANSYFSSKKKKQTSNNIMNEK